MRRVGRRALLSTTVRVGVGLSGGILFAACAGAPPTPTPASAPAAAPTTPPKPAATLAPAAAPKPAAKELTVSWWNTQPFARTKGLWESIEKDIHEAYPNITVKTTVIPWSDYEPKVLSGLAGKNLGDIIDAEPEVTRIMAMRGALVPLDDYVKTTNWKESDFTIAWQYHLWRGKRWALPRSDNPTVILYNKKMVADAGLPDPFGLFKEDKWDIAAWDKMMAAVSKGEGEKRVFGMNVGAALEIQNLWIWGAGGEVWNPEETQTLIAEPPALKAWDYLAKIHSDNWKPSPEQLKIPGGTVSLMGQRRLVSGFVGAQFVLGGQAQYLPEDVQKEMHLAPMFEFWNGKREIRNAVNAQGLYREGKQRDEAWKAAAYLLSEKAQQKIIEARWTSPLFKSWLKSDMWVKTLRPEFESADMWEVTVNNVHFFHYVPRYVEIDDTVQKEFDSVLLKRKELKPAMTEAAAKVNKILQEVDDEVKASPYLK